MLIADCWRSLQFTNIRNETICERDHAVFTQSHFLVCEKGNKTNEDDNIQIKKQTKWKEEKKWECIDDNCIYLHWHKFMFARSLCFCMKEFIGMHFIWRCKVIQRTMSFAFYILASNSSSAEHLYSRSSSNVVWFYSKNDKCISIYHVHRFLFLIGRSHVEHMHGTFVLRHTMFVFCMSFVRHHVALAIETHTTGINMLPYDVNKHKKKKKEKDDCNDFLLIQSIECFVFGRIFREKWHRQ